MKRKNDGNIFEDEHVSAYGTPMFAPPEHEYDADLEGKDPLYETAIITVVKEGQASTSLLQRRLHLGYFRAANIMDALEAGGMIGPYEGSKPRQVLVTYEQLELRIPGIFARVQQMQKEQQTEQLLKWQEISRRPSFKLQVALYSIISWVLEPIPLISYVALLVITLIGARDETHWPWIVILYTTIFFLMCRSGYEIFSLLKNPRRKLVFQSKRDAFIQKKWGVERPITNNQFANAASSAQALHSVQPKQETLLKMDMMDGHQFEYFCADLLKKNGFENVEVTQASGDYGIDILAQKDSVTYAIQCKCYSNNIGNHAVQEAHSGATYYGRMVAVVMTNQYFTPAAKETAERTHVLLWDRDKISQMIK